MTIAVTPYTAHRQWVIVSATMSDVVQVMRTEERVLDIEAPASARATTTIKPPSSAPLPIAPVRPKERIQSVDVLRGVALLCILFVNINAFGLPHAAGRDPSVYGGASGANLATWMTTHVLFEGKMRAIFSMLFGASVIIMTARAERKGAGVEIADIYYRRTLWLAAFGVVHAYLFWSGDILFHYGIVGLALFPLRKLSGRTLCIIGALLLTVDSAQGFRRAFRFEHMSQSVADDQAIIASGRRLSDEQKLQWHNDRETRSEFKPDAKIIEQEIRTARGGYLTNLIARAPIAASQQSDTFYRVRFWDIAGMLVLGMGLMKLGVFDASRSLRFYTWMAIIGYGIGLPLAIATAMLWWRSGFDPIAMFRYIRAPGDLLRFSIAAGHIAVVMIICQSGLLPRVTRALANVGRMALTNYILMSALCTLYFCGYGLGMFARLQRFELLYVLCAVLAVNVIFSAIWLTLFQFGPLEWLWRSLTYCKLQPLRLAPARK